MAVYNAFKKQLMLKTINMDTDTIKVALMTNSFVFNANEASNDEWSDVSANEVSGPPAGYTTGGATIANTSVTVNDTTDVATFDGDNVVWTTSTITAYHAVIYDDTTATKYLIAAIDFGGAQISSSGNFTISWHNDGILTIG